MQYLYLYVCEYSTMASAFAFQAEDASSILVTRSKKKFNEKFDYLKNYLYLCIMKQIQT